MPTLVQAVKARGSGTSVSISCTATTAGNFLLLVIGEGGAANPTFTITTPASGFTAEAVVRQNVFNNESGQMFYDQNCAAGITSVTITSSLSMGGCSVWLMEFSGCDTSASPIDVYTSSAPATSSASPSISTTTTQAGDLVVGVIMSDVGNALGTPAQPASPWTSFGAYEEDLAGWEATQGAYQVQSSAGSITYNPTQTVSQDYILWLIAIKAASGGTTPLTAQAGLMVLSPPAAAALTIAVALTAQSGKSVLIGSTATMAVAVALTASAGVAVLVTPAATLALAVALTSAPTVAVLIAPSATMAVAVALSASPALAILNGSNATLALGGQLLAQAGVMVLSPPAAAATLRVAVALVSPTPALAVLAPPAAPAALLLAVPLVTGGAVALAVLVGSNATLIILGVVIIGAASVSDATVAGAAPSDALVGAAALEDV